MIRTIAAATLLVVAVPAAAAPHWNSLASASTLKWTARWEGTPVRGAFPDFTVAADFSASDPAGGKIDVDIAVAHVRTASADVTETIRSKPWFDPKQFPRARFNGTFAMQGHALQLRGTLQLKGHRRQLTIPVTLVPQGGSRVHLSGSIRLDRSDFAIGSGEWASGDVIAKAVLVEFSIVLVRGA